ncbi:hypothetical protein D3C87_226900 [compost metagenome]
MKILNFISNIIKGKPKTGQYSYVLELPKLNKGEFALVRAERNTGIILNEKFKYAGFDHTTVYTTFSHLEKAIYIAKEIVKANTNVEVWIHNHKEQPVYFTELAKESFHRPDFEFNFKLSQQLNKLSDDRLLHFALTICKRLLPEYLRFYNTHSWGDPGTLQDAITYCESHPIAQLQISKLQVYQSRIETITPNTEEFGNYEVSYALNAACSVMALLDFLITGNKASIVEISTYMTDTIYFKCAEKNPDLTDKELDEHPDKISEWKYQLELLQIS